MSPINLALEYLDIFMSGERLDRLHGLFAEDLEFKGPFFEFHSAREYVDSLKASPPTGCSCNILRTFENGPAVNIIYEFEKPGVRAEMSQFFEMEDGKIKKILLIFDSARFK